MLKRTVSLRQFFRVPVTYVLVKKYKIDFKVLTLIRRPDMGSEDKVEDILFLIL